MSKQAFTLVELIVVITILSVLATVAFISFQGYAASSRDSVRLSDIKSMEKVINLYRLTNSKYPTPNAETSITYSGSTAWIQGVFGTNSYTKNTNLSDVPLDPITQLPYAYSVTNRKNEYQIAVVLENPVSNKTNTQTYAGDQLAQAYVKGDYNGQFLKVQTGSLDYLLGVPSILASDITSVDVMEIIQNQRLVYKGYNNLPASYSGSIYNNNGGFDFAPNKVVLFEGDIDDFSTNPATRLDFLDNLEENYSGTEISSESEIAKILDIKSGSPSVADNYVVNILNNSLKTEILIQNKVISACNDELIFSEDSLDGVNGYYTNKCTGLKLNESGNLSSYYQWSRTSPLKEVNWNGNFYDYPTGYTEIDFPAFKACTDLGNKWRLPTKDEFITFIGLIEKRNYWTSTISETSPDLAWYGYTIGGYMREGNNYARKIICVHD